MIEEISPDWGLVDKRIAIVGSVELSAKQERDAEHLIYMIWMMEGWHEGNPYHLGLVSGGAGGIDTLGERHAKKHGDPTAIFKPTVKRWWGEGGFQERNMKVAETCDTLYRIARWNTTTYGSGWTADYAERCGKRVYRYYV